MIPGASSDGEQAAHQSASATSALKRSLVRVSIPDHQLLRCIGQGSYGAVWLARSTMGMYRAVKVIHRKSFENHRPFERELAGIRKFEPISRSHEGFVDVLHVGINDAEGYFYYIMELGDDQRSGQSIDPDRYTPKTLADEVRQHQRLPAQNCLELGMALSLALSELHRQGLVHRDIKPSNIIFVNGVPKLADIGLVAGINETPSYVGTEGFIPPEGPGTPQADVYGLGKVLYEACTGRDRMQFPNLPDAFDTLPDYERLLELDEVILQACSQEASKRYRSAWEMHADLVAIANGKSIKRLRTLERRWSKVKRGAGIALLGLAVLGAVLFEINRERGMAREARQRQVGAKTANGTRATESGDLLGALPYFADALRLDRGSSARETTHRLRLSSVQAQCPKLTHLWFEDRETHYAQFSPDGQQALVSQLFGKAKIYDLKTGELYAPPFGPPQLSTAAYDPTGRFIVTASQEGAACLWNVTNLSCVLPLAHPKRVLGAAFSPDGALVLTACEDGVARIWDVGANQPKILLKGHRLSIKWADFNHDGKLVATASDDGSARIWNAATGQQVGPALLHGSWVTCVAFSADDKKLVTGCLDRKARVWEVATGRRIPPDLNHGDAVVSTQFSPDGRLILTASLDGMVRIWEIESLEPFKPISVLRHGKRVIYAGFSPDSRRIVSTCSDGSVRIWDLAGALVLPTPVPYSFSQDGGRSLLLTNNSVQVWDQMSGKEACPPIHPKSPVERAELTRNGHFFVSLSKPEGATNGLLQVWDVASGDSVGPGLTLSNPLTGFALAENGNELVTLEGKTARVWDVLSQTSPSQPLMPGLQVGGAVFSPDGACLATRSGNSVQVWETANGRAAFGALKHPQSVQHMEFSSDGKYLATCCSDIFLTECFAQVWSARTGRPIGPKLKHADGVLRIEFSPDSRRVVTASEDFTAAVWDAAKGTRLATFKHADKVRSAAFSRDGRWVVTASLDKTARIWDAESGEPLTPPLRHSAALISARFLADNRKIVTLDKQGNTRVWDLPVDQTPASDLQLLARLLSSGAEMPELTAPAQAEPLKILWQRMRAKYPAYFTVSSQEIAAWHDVQAQDSDLNDQWFAAAFHLKRLSLLRRSDRSLPERLVRTQDRQADNK
jgi:WD40 repeat protein/serine/threonine protein kinase